MNSRWFVAMLMGILFAAMPAPAQDVSKIVGDWLGSLNVGSIKLRLVVHITRGDDGTLRATLDSIDQNAHGIPVDVVTFDGKTLHLELPPIQGTYDGTLDDAATTLTGTWTQRGTSLPLEMKRTEDAASLVLKRPQEPKPPFPYDSRDVTFANGLITLAGTLTLPRSAGPHAAVVLISGSGPQNRDEAVMGHRPFLVLSDYLTRQGIAVLRYDDRGVAKSTGTFETATSADFASDAEAAVAYLKTLPEIDAKHIGLIGHSEGGIVAPIVATHSKDVAFVVLMAGVGVPIDELLRAQSRLLLQASGADSAYIAQNEALSTRLFAIAKTEPDENTREKKLREAVDTFVKELPAAEQTMSTEEKADLEGSIQMVNSTWMRYLLSYDPAATLRKVKVPVLAVNGELDLQVPPSQNLPAIQKALTEGGNKDVTVVELPKLNHLFQVATTGAPSEYGTIEETMAPLALNTISDWIVAHTSRGKK